jgi:uncharacterized membrane protein YebE (DUF533 family)
MGGIGVNVQLETVLIALGAIVALVVLVKFGRAIGRFVLALVGIVAVALVALAILTQGAANFQTAKAAQETAQAVKVSAVGQALASLVVCRLVVALMGALGVAGYAVLRWQLAERQALAGWLLSDEQHPRPEACGAGGNARPRGRVAG